MTSQNDSVADPRLLPNPLTPLAFVAPKDAYTVAIAAYVLIGALSICMWDGLHCLSQDYVLLFKKKIGISTIVYVLSRIFTFIFALMVSIFATGPIKRCAIFRTVTNIFYLLCIPTTSFLFFLRVRAVYNRNKYVSVVFFTLWLVLLGYSLSLVTFIKGTNIGPTDYCTYAPLEVRDSATGIIFFTYDTLVFMAISWRLFSIFHVDDNPQKGLKAVVFGRCLPAFSKALLHDGQVYYLMSLATVLLSLALFFSTNLPTQMRAVFSVFTVTITNIMACRVFRNAKLGLYRKQGDPSQSLNNIPLNTFSYSRTGESSKINVPLPLGRGNEAVNSNGSPGLSKEEDRLKDRPVIHIVKTIEYYTERSHPDVQTTDSDDSKSSSRNNSLV